MANLEYFKQFLFILSLKLIYVLTNSSAKLLSSLNHGQEKTATWKKTYQEAAFHNQI